MNGFTVIKTDKITSTNDYLKSNYTTLKHKHLITSQIQTRGRGRSDHNWMSEKGNLYFSYLLKDQLTQEKIFHELVKISVLLVELLDKFNVKATIKYPNDILVDHKKIAGILIESKVSNNLEYIVVGVGFNINQFDFKELSGKATSLVLETKKEYDCMEILKKILDSYPDAHDFSKYIQYSMVVHKKIKYQNQSYVVKGIMEDGRLHLEGDETIYVSPNEISLEEIY